MIRIYVECKKCYGIKDPLWDESVTHGLCDAYYSFITKVKELRLKLKLQNEKNNE
jgi:hypothetical protein